MSHVGSHPCPRCVNNCYYESDLNLTYWCKIISCPYCGYQYKWEHILANEDITRPSWITKENEEKPFGAYGCSHVNGDEGWFGCIPDDNIEIDEVIDKLKAQVASCKELDINTFWITKWDENTKKLDFLVGSVNLVTKFD